MFKVSTVHGTLKILPGGWDVGDYAGDVAEDGGEAHQPDQQLEDDVDQLHLVPGSTPHSGPVGRIRSHSYRIRSQKFGSGSYDCFILSKHFCYAIILPDLNVLWH